MFIKHSKSTSYMQKLKIQRTDEIESYGNPVADLVKEPGLLILSASFPV